MQDVKRANVLFFFTADKQLLSAIKAICETEITEIP